MSTMKAVVITNLEDSLLEHASVPVPQNTADELLVRVKAVGVGIHDSYFLPAGLSTPYPIGIEAAGIVEQVGSELSGQYAPGDRITFVSAHQIKGGTWAEYAVVHGGSLIVPIPEGLDFERAAAVPVAANTVLRALSALPPVPAGGSVFVAGASGAIGTFAVQLARANGWTVAGLASPQNHEYLTSLGVDETVDYHDADWPDQIREWMPGGVDVAIAVQPDTTAGCLGVVKDGGTAVSISGDQVQAPPGVTVMGPAYGIDVSHEVRAFLEQIAAGEVHLEIEQIYPFDDALAALARVQTRHTRGKLVLTLD